MNISFTSLAALVPALALAACTSEAQLQTSSLTAGAHYVALGSSYAAGAGIGAIKADTPERCGRTVNNYASLLAADLDLNLDDQSCSGATTDHLLGDWDELPAQLAAVGPDARLVTVTVGGNDLNYMGLVFTASCNPETGMVIGGERSDCPPKVGLPAEVDYAQVEANLTAIAQRVHEQAPGATLVFVQYVTLVPDEACAGIPLSAQDAANARQLASRLSQITVQVAEANGAKVLAADQLSAQHTACADQPWSRSFVAGYDGSQGAPWHPTAAGHAAIADALAKMLAN